MPSVTCKRPPKLRFNHYNSRCSIMDQFNQYNHDEYQSVSLKVNISIIHKYIIILNNDFFYADHFPPRQLRELSHISLNK